MLYITTIYYRLVIIGGKKTINKPKLSSYVEFKDNYETELHVLDLMSRENWSFLAQLHCGILPLELETGKWYNITIEKRKCKLCSSDSIENEILIFYSNAVPTSMKENLCLEN